MPEHCLKWCGGLSVNTSVSSHMLIRRARGLSLKDWMKKAQSAAEPCHLHPSLRALISAQVKAGCDELSEEGMPSEKPLGYKNSGVRLACRLSWLRCLSPLSASTGPGANQIGFSLREGERRRRWVRGRTYWHSRGVKCQHSAESRLKKSTGQMSMWLIHDKSVLPSIWLRFWGLRHNLLTTHRLCRFNAWQIFSGWEEAFWKILKFF